MQANVRLGCLCLIATSNDIADGQASGLHGEIDRYVGTLSQNCDPAFDLAAAMLIWPNTAAIECV